MAEKSLWHDGRNVGDAGLYDAAEMRGFFKRITGHDADDALRGVLLGVGDSLAVTPASPASKSVVVGAGAAIVNGSPYYNDSSLALAVEDNTGGYTRVDRVALELDYVAKTVRAVVIKGPEDGSAEPAALVQSSSYFQVPVARVTLASGYSTITESEIADDRHFANLPGVVAPELTNGSGAEVDAGTVVALDASADRSFDTSTTVSDPGVIGAAMERIPAAGSGKIATAGIALVKVTGAVSRGDALVQSAAAGVAQAGIGGFAVALTENASGAGTVWALIRPTGEVFCSCVACRTSAQSIAAGATVAMTFNADDEHDTHNMHAPGSDKIYAPFDGYYAVNAYITAWSVNYFDAYLYKNISLIAGQSAAFVTDDGVPRVSISRASVYMNAGDYVQVRVKNEEDSSAEGYKGNMALVLLRVNQ
jgi:hypothetical protein